MRKLLFLLLVSIFLLSACGNDEVKESDETKEDSNQVEQEDQPEEKTIKVEEEFELDNLKIEIETVKVDGDKLTVPFWWSHWASNDKVHFEALAYVVVKQDGEELEQTDGHDSVLKQKEKGVDDRAELEYKLKDDSPVEITFKTTTDDPEEETIEIDIE